MSDRIIDIHPHIVSPDTTRYPPTPIGGIRSDWSQERSVDFEQLVAAMDEASVAKAAIVHSSTTYGFTNDYVADSIKGNRDRFTGVFSVNVTQPDAPEKMRHWHSLGMDGMRIYVRGSTIKTAWMDIDDPIAAPAWKCAADMGISVCANVPARDEGLGQIKNILKTYPSVPLLIDHLGRPQIEDGPPYRLAQDFFDLAKFPNIYLKLTPSGLAAARKGKATLETYVARLVQEFGSNRIAWGSNFPSSPGTLKTIVDESRELLSTVSAADREWIFARTAETLYPSLKSAANARSAAAVAT
jgi:L-fuconolactonase